MSGTEELDYRHDSAVGRDPVSKKVPKQNPYDKKSYKRIKKTPNHLNRIHIQSSTVKIYEICDLYLKETDRRQEGRQ